MPRIKLTPEVLEEKSNLLTNTAQRNDDVISRLDMLINGLVSDWEGEAQTEFANSYRTKRESFESFTEEMRVFAEFLAKFADIMRQEEKRQADAARGLAG